MNMFNTVTSKSILNLKSSVYHDTIIELFSEDELANISRHIRNLKKCINKHILLFNAIKNTPAKSYKTAYEVCKETCDSIELGEKVIDERNLNKQLKKFINYFSSQDCFITTDNNTLSYYQEHTINSVQFTSSKSVFSQLHTPSLYFLYFILSNQDYCLAQSQSQKNHNKAVEVFNDISMNNRKGNANELILFSYLTEYYYSIGLKSEIISLNHSFKEKLKESKTITKKEISHWSELLCKRLLYAKYLFLFFDKKAFQHLFEIAVLLITKHIEYRSKNAISSKVETLLYTDFYAMIYNELNAYLEEEFQKPGEDNISEDTKNYFYECINFNFTHLTKSEFAKASWNNLIRNTSCFSPVCKSTNWNAPVLKDFKTMYTAIKLQTFQLHQQFPLICQPLNMSL